MSDTLSIWVHAVNEERSGGVKGGIFRSSDENAAILTKVPVERLRESLADLVQGVGRVFEDAKKVGAFRLKQVSFAVEVSAEGGFQLIGTAKMGGKGTIELTFEE
jgi:hypothetical protein